MNDILLANVQSAIGRFCRWLDRYGETSYDYQTFYASKLGGHAKALYYHKRLLGAMAVAPMVFCEAFLPSGRRLFGKPQRFPIADAHFAMGFALLSRTAGADENYRRAVHFLEVLEQTRCPGFDDYCWGYPFNWETRTGTIPVGTPLITTVPYAYEAFAHVYAVDKEQKWREIMRSIAEHVLKSYRDWETGTNTATCAYTPSPHDRGKVINASAYRAFLLTQAAHDFSERRYQEAANRNLNFVLASQNADGSWFYASDGVRDFVDHFHTCFVLKALAKIESLTACPRCRDAIRRGVDYYRKNLFDAEGLPLPFAKAPRMTVYRRELYDYAECINLALLLRRRFPEFGDTLAIVVKDVLTRWQRPDGSFRSRKLLVGWDNTPMHRWAGSQLFRSLCLLLSQQTVQTRPTMASPCPQQQELNVSR